MLCRSKKGEASRHSSERKDQKDENYPWRAYVHTLFVDYGALGVSVREKNGRAVTVNFQFSQPQLPRKKKIKLHIVRYAMSGVEPEEPVK
jgi:hypothetical protein